MRNEELTSEQGGDHPKQRPTLTVVEAAQVCGVSTSTIRRHLRAGRFPRARQQPSTVSGQPGQWLIPTEDLMEVGLDRRRPASSGHVEQHRSTGDPAGTRAAMDRVRALEHALELERTRRQAAEVLAAERARTILTLETALRAVQHPRPAPGTNASAAQVPVPAKPPGVLNMVPRPRRLKGELSQEERAAIIGRALSRERPPKRRWGWW
jgi:predicted DNA-binding transcriptional regulator AlpA